MIKIKYYSLALFIFVLHVSMAVINATGVFPMAKQPMSEWFDKVNDDQLANEEYVQSSVSSTSVWGTIADFVKGLFYFIVALGLGIIAVPYTLGIFGMVAPFTYYFSLPFYLIYLVALAQIIANRAGKNYS